MVVRDKLLNPRGGNLRDHVADLLVVRARVERLYDVPMIVLFLQLHFARGSLEHDPNDLRHDKIRQFSIAKFLRLFVDIFLYRWAGEESFLRVFEPHIHLPFQRSVFSEEDCRRRIRAEQFQAQLWIC